MSPMDHAREDLKPYRLWSPTPYDIKGLNCDDRQEWLVAPCGTNRDADCLTRSNWEVQLRELERTDPDGNDHERHSFNHWACGWFDIVLVRPESPCAELCGGFVAALGDYPILSDEHLSSLEWEETVGYWEGMSLRDRVRECQRAGVSVFAARRNEVPELVYERLRDAC